VALVLQFLDEYSALVKDNEYNHLRQQQRNSAHHAVPLVSSEASKDDLQDSGVFHLVEEGNPNLQRVLYE
jgi:antirestriction protein